MTTGGRAYRNERLLITCSKTGLLRSFFIAGHIEHFSVVSPD